MRLIPRTILGQLIAGTLVVQALVFAVFLGIGLRKQADDAERQNGRRLKTQAHVLASLSADAMGRRDGGELNAIYRSVAVTVALKGARLTDESGHTLRVSNAQISPELSDWERALLPQLRQDPRYRLHTSAFRGDEAILPFEMNGKVRGIVWLYTDALVAAHTTLTVLQYAFIYGFCALIGNLLLIWTLSSTIARPLRELRKASLGVVNDPNDLSAFPLRVRSRSETGELMESVNTMVQEIALQRSGTQDTLSLLDSMLINAPIGFAFFDHECRYVRVNDHLARTHGVPVANHLGKRLRDLMPSGASTSVADQKEYWIQEVFKTGEAVHDREIVGVMPGAPEEVRTWLDNFFPVRASSGEVRWVGVIVNEITTRLRAEEAMRRSEKLAAAGRLAASIAHEINNPLESVTNLLYLIREHPSLDPEAQSYTELAQQELARVAEITQQTLRFYRQSTSAQNIRLADVIRSVLVLHHGRLQAMKIDVVRRIDEEAVLFAYTGELRQLFANLVGNAIDAMPRGGHLFLRVRPGNRQEVQGIWVTVGDSGTGMPEHIRRRIFEPFFTTKEATGTGLGLWVSDEILSKHRGVVSVRSREGRFPGDYSGTVFRIFFPLNGVPRGPVPVPPQVRVMA